jgi:hypothetical protein
VETPSDENILAGGGFHIQHAGKLVARYGTFVIPYLKVRLIYCRRAETPPDENVLAGGGFHIQHAGKLVARYEYSPPCTVPVYQALA